jgi:hypothetical protein
MPVGSTKWRSTSPSISTLWPNWKSVGLEKFALNATGLPATLMGKSAAPFQWTFTREDLTKLMIRLRAKALATAA